MTRKNRTILVSVSLFLLTLTTISCSDKKEPEVMPVTPVAPPFSGTIFIDPDIITSSDPTTFLNVSSSGQGSRTMYDRRVNGWITVDAFLYNATFDDGLGIEIQVNPEFGNTATG